MQAAYQTVVDGTGTILRKFHNHIYALWGAFFLYGGAGNVANIIGQGTVTVPARRTCVVHMRLTRIFDFNHDA